VEIGDAFATKLDGGTCCGWQVWTRRGRGLARQPAPRSLRETGRLYPYGGVGGAHFGVKLRDRADGTDGLLGPGL
jgi:hypothetical protein